jgi:hypothetical protein
MNPAGEKAPNYDFSLLIHNWAEPFL